MNNDVNQFFNTITGRILLVLVLLIIGFFGGMEYKAYQVRKALGDSFRPLQQIQPATQTNRASLTVTKTTLDNARPQAELYYASNNNSYKGVCTDQVNGIAASMINNLSIDQSATCNDSATAYAIEAPLPDNSNYCVDSAGNSKVEVNELGNATVCS